MLRSSNAIEEKVLCANAIIHKNWHIPLEDLVWDVSIGSTHTIITEVLKQHKLRNMQPSQRTFV